MNTHLIEEEIESETVFDGALLHVLRDRVRLPDGEEATREWIDHPGAAAVLPILPNGNVLMVRQYRYASRRLFIELPAGKFDEKGEAPDAVAARELEEETGWKPGRLHPVGKAYACIGYSNELIHFYVADELAKGARNLEDEEFLDVLELPLDDVFRMVEEGEIDDMKTVAGLYFAHAFLTRKARENESK